MTMIFDCDHFQLISRSGPAKPLLITFSSLGMFDQNGPLANGKMFWGQKLADDYDYPAIGFVAKQRDWFCGPNMDHACRLVAELASTYPRVVAYGNGMGGYAALRWGRQAGAKTAIAFSPQFSIDPSAVGFDTRYRYAFQPDIHRGMEIRHEHLSIPSFIFFDPTIQVDRVHASLIQEVAPEVREVPLHFCGHECIRVFGHSELAAKMIELCADGRFQDVLTFAAKSRRASAIRIVELSMRTAGKKPNLARRLFCKFNIKFEAQQREALFARLEVQHPTSRQQRIDPNGGRFAAFESLRSRKMVTDAAASIVGESTKRDTPSERLRIVHLHIPKTAGTSLRTAFEQQFRDHLRVFPHWDEAKIAAAAPQDYDFYSGHIGFNTAKRLGGDIVTVFRHPRRSLSFRLLFLAPAPRNRSRKKRQYRPSFKIFVR